MNGLNFKGWLIAEGEPSDVSRIKLRDGSRIFNGTSTSKITEKSRLKDKLMDAKTDADIVKVVDEILASGHSLKGKNTKNSIHKWLLENRKSWPCLHELLESDI